MLSNGFDVIIISILQNKKTKGWEVTSLLSKVTQ